MPSQSSAISVLLSMWCFFLPKLINEVNSSHILLCVCFDRRGNLLASVFSCSLSARFLNSGFLFLLVGTLGKVSSTFMASCQVNSLVCLSPIISINKSNRALFKPCDADLGSASHFLADILLWIKASANSDSRMLLIAGVDMVGAGIDDIAVAFL